MLEVPEFKKSIQLMHFARPRPTIFERLDQDCKTDSVHHIVESLKIKLRHATMKIFGFYQTSLITWD